MKVDFWQLSRDPVEKVVTLIARRVMDQGERLLVVSKHAEQREAIGRELWHAGPDSFLANGQAGETGAERQPILLSDQPEAANGASHVIYADGEFREPSGFERAFLLFDESTKEAARGVWTSLDGIEGLERAYFEQVGGKWDRKG